MITVSSSYSFFNNERYSTEGMLPPNIQLALYKYELFIEKKNDILKKLDDSQTKVNVLHLPIDCLRYDHKYILEIIQLFHKLYGCIKFVIHPNRGIHSFIDYFLSEKTTGIKLCIENFPYKKKKRIRTPIEIIEFCIKYPEKFGLTFDTSHADPIWFDYKILYYIIKYTEVIHLSNRKGKNQHIPFNSQDGDLNLVQFVKDLVNRYGWEGDIVLEYMPEYRNKLYKNTEYIQQLIQGR